MTVTLRADAEIQRLAKEALEIQNACNCCGLAHRFVGVLCQLARSPESRGTAWINQHPITRMWLGKFVDLARMDVDYVRFDRAYDQVQQLADGEAIEVTMPEDH
jgi:hypothetical protein